MRAEWADKIREHEGKAHLEEPRALHWFYCSDGNWRNDPCQGGSSRLILDGQGGYGLREVPYSTGLAVDLR